MYRFLYLEGLHRLKYQLRVYQLEGNIMFIENWSTAYIVIVVD